MSTPLAFPTRKIVVALGTGLLCLAFTLTHPAGAEPSAAQRWWPDTVEQALNDAGNNRAELVKALTKAPKSQREGIQFLIEHMRTPDRQTLSADFLLENLSLAYATFEKAPWRDQIPQELFLNDILPYASITEKRDNWRQTLHEKCAPLITDCKTPAEAARRLNERLFKLVKVKYSTKRKRADQSPLETMDSGIASCTGLSILLVDACRSVGVPARVVGTPMWTNMRGNHTWVEVWDKEWHFAGAAEPSGKGLNHGWFVHDASKAIKDSEKHAIYASSYKKTGTHFPLLWAKNDTSYPAFNVTDRYTPKSAPSGKSDNKTVRLLVKVLDRPAGKRVVAKVALTDPADAKTKLAGTSRSDTADNNDILPFKVAPNHAYKIKVTHGDRVVEKPVRAGTNAQEVVIVYLNPLPSLTLPSQACYAPPTTRTPLKDRQETRIKKAMTKFFTAGPDEQASWKFSRRLEKLLRENEASVRHAAWEAYKEAPLHEQTRADYEAKIVRTDRARSPYTLKTVGTRPENGWALFIAMHGGGGVPPEINDRGWRRMQEYYRDHPEAGGYHYLALRAPNDTWNGFYDSYVYPLIGKLVRQFLLFGDVDPNKVFIMGYSHGGYGAFAIGPRIPDRFAAIHASAAAPSSSPAIARNLRNTVFTFMIGEKDTAHGRINRCRDFNKTVKKLRADYPDEYPIFMQLIEAHGHGGLPDRDKIKAMYPAVRHPAPTKLTWHMADSVISDFFWLHVPSPAGNQVIEASCLDNRLIITTNPKVRHANVLLDSRLIDFDEPVTLELNGQTSTVEVQPSLRTLGQTLVRRGDPNLAFTTQVSLPITPYPSVKAPASKAKAGGD